jgi:hypothetical protein
MRIFHVATSADWQRAQASGSTTSTYGPTLAVSPAPARPLATSPLTVAFLGVATAPPITSDHGARA